MKSKNIKRIFLLATLIILLLSITSINATSDNTTSNDNTISDNAIENQVNDNSATNTTSKLDTQKNIQKNIKKTPTTTRDYYVSDSSGKKDNDGSQENPFKTIQQALDKTDLETEYNIHIDEGTYKGDDNTNLTVDGNKYINFIGMGINKTVFDGEANYIIHKEGTSWGNDPYWNYYDYISGNHALTITNGNGLISIENFSIQNMISPGGSSISAYDHATIDNYGNLKVNNIYFKENLAGIGAGIRNNNGSNLYVNNSIFEKNRKGNSTGNYGAGIYNNATALVENSEFIENAARWGTITNDKKLKIVNCTIRDGISYNLASTYKMGSGITIDTSESNYYEDGENNGIITEIINCNFINNSQCDIYQGNIGNLIIDNCTFNQSTGIYIQGTKLNDNPPYIIINNSNFQNIKGSTLFGSLSSSSTVINAIYKTTQHNLTVQNSNISTNTNGRSITTNSRTLILNNTINNLINLTQNDNIITENNINTLIYIRGTNNTVANNTIKTNGTYVITIEGIKNIIMDNYIESTWLTGDNAVFSQKNNKIANNTPKTVSNIITESTYSYFFDNNGYLRDNLNMSMFRIGGQLHDKKLIFDQNNEIIINGLVDCDLIDCTIDVKGSTKINIQNITMHTNSETNTYQLILNSSGNLVNNSKFYTDSYGTMNSIIISADNNTLIRTVIENNANSNKIKYDNDYYGICDTTGLLILSSNNNITNISINMNNTETNEDSGVITGISIQSKNNTSNNNLISGIILNINGISNVYGLNILNGHNNKITAENNQNELFNITSDGYAIAIQLSGNVTNNNITTNYSRPYAFRQYGININSKKGYGILINGSVNAEHNDVSMTMTLENNNELIALAINNTNDTFLNLTINETNMTTTQKLIAIDLNNAKNTNIISKIDSIQNSNSTGININNSNNITITSDHIIMNNSVGIKINNSKDINIHNLTIITTDNTIIVNNSANISIQENYLLKNNQTGSDASVNIINSTEVILKNNRPEKIILTQTNYDDYFIDGVFKLDYLQTIVNLESDLYGKNLTFSNDVDFYGNNYCIYNGTIRLNGTNNTIYSTNFNSTDNRQTLIEGNINGTTKLNNSTIYHESTDLIRTMKNIQLTNANITVIGIEKETNDKSPSILILNNTSVSNSNIYVSSSGNNGHMVIIDSGNSISNSNLTANGNNITALIDTSINRGCNIDIYGKNYVNVMTAHKTGTISQSTITAKSQNEVVGFINVGTITDSNINVYSNNTGVIFYCNVDGRTCSFSSVNIYGENVNGIIVENCNSTVNLKSMYSNAINNLIINKTLNKTFYPVKIENVKITNTVFTYLEFGGINIKSDDTAILLLNNAPRYVNIQNANITTNSHAIVIKNLTTPQKRGVTISSNCNIRTTNNGPSIIINDTDIASVTGNFIKSNTLRGDLAVELNNVTSKSVTSNRPGFIITNDNYDEYFTDGIYNNAYSSIELGSDFYNKSFKFTSRITIDNSYNYTIYNGTISSNYTGVSGTNFNNIKLNYTGDNITLVDANTYSFINGSIILNGNDNKIFKTNSSSVFYITYNNITIEGNNNTVLNQKGSIYFNYNNINANTNNSILLSHETAGYLSPQTNYNNITINGQNNTLLIKNTTGTITSNNINVNTTTPTTLIILNKATSMTNNNITINTEYNTLPVIYTNTTRINNNYIQTLDLIGDNTIYTDNNAQIINNTPLDNSNYLAKLDVNIPEIILNNTNNTINITATDIFGTPINNEKIYLVDNNQIIISSISNGQTSINYIPKEAGNQNITIYVDKYDLNNITLPINVIIKPATIELNPINGYVNTPTIITVNITDEMENPINTGYIIFTDNNRKIGQSNLENGLASIEVTYKSATTTNITATYINSESKLNNLKNTTTLTINKLKTTTEINITTESENLTLTATVQDEFKNNINTGKVVFKINGVSIKDTNGRVIYVQVKDGVAQINYTLPSKWIGKNITIQAVYSGSSKYESSRNETIQTIEDSTIENHTSPTITTQNINTNPKSTITLTATIKNNNKVINTGKVSFKINGKTVKDANGKVIYAQVVNNTVSVEYTLPDNLKTGNYTLTVVYTSGNTKLEDSKLLTII